MLWFDEKSISNEYITHRYMLLLYLRWKYVEVGYLGRSSSDGIALKIPNIRFLPSNFTSMVSNEKMGIRFQS